MSRLSVGGILRQIGCRYELEEIAPAVNLGRFF